MIEVSSSLIITIGLSFMAGFFGHGAHYCLKGVKEWVGFFAFAMLTSFCIFGVLVTNKVIVLID